MLELLLELLNITDGSKDNILNHYLIKAKKSIQSYLNYKDDEFILIKDKFGTQIMDLAIFYYKNRSNSGIIQQSQGSRSMTIERGIPKNIKESLPLPRVRVVG